MLNIIGGGILLLSLHVTFIKQNFAIVLKLFRPYYNLDTATNVQEAKLENEQDNTFEILE